jgi:hypothetical protein
MPNEDGIHSSSAAPVPYRFYTFSYPVVHLPFPTPEATENRLTSPNGR